MNDYYPVICGSKTPAKVLCAVLAVVLLALAVALLAAGGIDDHGDRVRQLTPTSAEVVRWPARR